ncbi:MAG TPA: NAD(P)-dependent oxidoreductase [Ferruginibacter sp.]|jgi:glutamate synthase (NADPH/NADH) small chain|nr:NAD(P)-dependent oxidoreductase [Bacteroidota bacterium]HPA22855.1 NAD(P)-dependent oxidoreductase [Ferruginibacter sp.]HQV43186.1 NAD(P)-dependent oxidoreductase [Ferruginibacter sp.]HQW60886.1 NAD(P)-dependent oxidoreductase [Ferruginibacter sp.]HQY17304.1 NAD(P)-dependent oxidoreductase [Ferruginibacter sp.]
MIQNNRLTKEEYTKNFSDVHPPFETLNAALVEANRCLFCYDAPCTKSCPTSIDVPKFIKQITTGNIKGSAHTILSSNIVGAGCSRVCPVEKLCEGACVFNLMEEKPIPIARLQRFSTDAAIKNQWQLFERKKPTGKKVAIVGAGPAGLSCAHNLSCQGVDVTIFEKEQKGGGLMTYGIAAYKVSPQFCDDEVNFITAIGGITIKYKKELGKDFTLEELQKNYDAVYLAIGVGLARQLNIPGENAQGVEDAISFIYTLRNNGFSSVAVGNNVAVIGLGMTAIDAATQAKRLGAQKVTIIYRRTENEKPCTQVELDLALLDGCEIIWLAAPKEVLTEAGKVKALVCSKMQLGEPDTSGRRSPIETGETFTLQADMIIKAAGQMPFENLISQYNISNAKGKIKIDENSSTSIKGVFAGGDAVNGGKEVVDAVQAGKDGAKAILHYIFHAKA